jgi:hypothetical protein
VIFERGTMHGQSKAAGYHALMAAVIDRAMLDLKGIGPKCRAVETDRAMAFILGEDCETFCLELGIDHEAVKGKAAALYQRIVENDSLSKVPKNAGTSGK